MVESGYVYNAENFALEHYYEEPADYNQTTYQTKQVCLEDLSDCRFSYSDGLSWQEKWDEPKEQLPRMIKINFRFKDEEQEREFIVNIPISP